MADLRCNALACRKVLALEGQAVVTTCQHIFCVNCANSLFGTPQVCPACDVELPESDDAIAMKFELSESYKTSVLAGLDPATILEITRHAVNFYSYQIQQEAVYQSIRVGSETERANKNEAHSKKALRDKNAEIKALRTGLHDLEAELAKERKKSREMRTAHETNANMFNKVKAQRDQLLKNQQQKGGTRLAPATPVNNARKTPTFVNSPYAATPQQSATRQSRHSHQNNAGPSFAPTPIASSQFTASARPRTAFQPARLDSRASQRGTGGVNGVVGSVSGASRSGVAGGGGMASAHAAGTGGAGRSQPRPNGVPFGRVGSAPRVTSSMISPPAESRASGANGIVHTSEAPRFLGQPPRAQMTMQQQRNRFGFG